MNASAVLYSAVGEELTRYEIDLEGAALTRRETVETPAVVQYAWPHPSKRYLYIATSNRGSGPGMNADFNHVSAYRIDPGSGTLTPHGEPQRLPARAVHICVDPKGAYEFPARTGGHTNDLTRPSSFCMLGDVDESTLGIFDDGVRSLRRRSLATNYSWHAIPSYCTAK